MQVQALGGLRGGLGCTDANGQTCSSSTLCSNIPAGDPYRVTAGNQCVGPDGNTYVFDANGNLTKTSAWYTTWWGITGILVVGTAASIFLLPHGGSGDSMLHGRRRRRR